MNNDKNTILKKKLRKDFLNCLQKNPQGNVVDDLIRVLEKDYILIVKKPLYSLPPRHRMEYTVTLLLYAPPDKSC